MPHDSVKTLITRDANWAFQITIPCPCLIAIEKDRENKKFQYPNFVPLQRYWQCQMLMQTKFVTTWIKPICCKTSGDPPLLYTTLPRYSIWNFPEISKSLQHTQRLYCFIQLASRHLSAPWFWTQEFLKVLMASFPHATISKEELSEHKKSRRNSSRNRGTDWSPPHLTHWREAGWEVCGRSDIPTAWSRNLLGCGD